MFANNKKHKQIAWLFRNFSNPCVRVLRPRTLQQKKVEIVISNTGLFAKLSGYFAFSIFLLHVKTGLKRLTD